MLYFTMQVSDGMRNHILVVVEVKEGSANKTTWKKNKNVTV
jgi:hypothetical protein